MSSFALKMLAVVTMLIDHIGASLGSEMPIQLAVLCRTVGRVAMPLFCFMIAEGLFHTRNAKKYLLRLGLFALISEVPFDLFLSTFRFSHENQIYLGGWVNLSSQNVGFTLFLGLLGILLYDIFAAQGRKEAALAAILAAGLAATLIQADYGFFGVYFIYIFYFFRRQNRQIAIALAAGVLLMTASQMLSGVSWKEAAVSLAALAAVIPVYLYSGKKGLGGKAVRTLLYLFYPAHLLLLYAAATVIK
ncbi:MAG: conjugal transfer protein TraX [Oscillospiraceae bacterium]|nr:conjugal transfer protein TraX [Oscillospiraceae bacterium]